MYVFGIVVAASDETPIGRASATLQVQLPADDADTLGGFIYTQLGKIPLPGDEVRYQNVLLKVINVAGRRIGKVRAQVLADEAAKEETKED